MLNKQVFFLFFLTVCLCARTPGASSPAIHVAKLDPKNKNRIWVQFTTPVALKDCQVEYQPQESNPPSCATPNPHAPWDVVVYQSSPALCANDPCKVAVLHASDIVGNLPANGSVRLDLEAGLPDKFSRIDVTFTGANSPHASIDPSGKPGGGGTWVSASQSKTDSNLYISGTFAPAEGSSPSYTIDSTGNYELHSWANGHYTISATGDVKTDNKKTADPDSFHWAIPVQYTGLSYFTIKIPTIGMEADKKGNAINLVSAPAFTRGFGKVFTVCDSKGGVDKVIASIGLDLSAGVEFGDNLKDDYAVANKTIGGQGWFFRGVPSASAYLNIPKVLHLSKISISSSYTARIPTTDEVFIETRHTSKPIPELTSNTRNFVQNSISFMFTDYVGIQIKHQYGALPPAFSFVRNSGSIGLVFALKQNRVP